MATERWLLGSVLLWLATLGGEKHQASRLGPVWVLGDSIGVGVAAGLRRLGVSVVDKAEVSTTTEQWRARVTATEEPRAKSVVVVSLGTNDAVSAVLRARWRDNALAVARVLIGRGHLVVWVLPPSAKSALPRLEDIAALRAEGVRVIWDRVPMADVWHPNVQGYDALAVAVEAVRKGDL